MKKQTILLATTNAEKIEQYKEVIDLIYPKGTVKPFDFKTLKQISGMVAPAEVGQTTLQNAMIKAEWYAYKTGMITISDDSAFHVDLLDGCPGIMSHREHWDMYKVLKDMAFKTKLIAEQWKPPFFDPHKRTARYITTVACCIPNKGMTDVRTFSCTKRLEGSVIEPMGEIPSNPGPDTDLYKELGIDHGYGYDPIFAPDLPDEQSARCFRAIPYLLNERKNEGFTRLSIGYPRTVALKEVMHYLITDNSLTI